MGTVITNTFNMRVDTTNVDAGVEISLYNEWQSWCDGCDDPDYNDLYFVVTKIGPEATGGTLMVLGPDGSPASIYYGSWIPSGSVAFTYGWGMTWGEVCGTYTAMWDIHGHVYSNTVEVLTRNFEEVSVLISNEVGAGSAPFPVILGHDDGVGGVHTDKISMCYILESGGPTVSCDMDGGYTIDPGTVTGLYTVVAYMASSNNPYISGPCTLPHTKTFSVFLKVDIVQSNVVGGVNNTNSVPFWLTPDSWTNVTWSISPDLGTNGAQFSATSNWTGSGFFTTNGTNVWVYPGPVTNDYTLTAQAVELPSCSDTGTLQVVGCQIAMDGNRDLKIEFTGTNDTGTCLFWLNDDYDVDHWIGTGDESPDGMGEDDEKLYLIDNQPNWMSDHIGARLGKAGDTSHPNCCLRDLEDFTVVQLKVSGVVTNLSGISYWVQFTNCLRGNPTVNLFKAVTNGMTGPFDYLTNLDVATNQVLEIKAFTNLGSTAQQVSTNFINRYDEPIGFLLEGCTTGKADLAFIVKKDGAELCRSSVSLELRKITDFYDKYRVGLVEYPRTWRTRWLMGETWSKDKWEAEVHEATTQVQTNTAYLPESDKYLLYVHGWNVDSEQRQYDAETVFKRLWWQKYKGGFGMFDWPTLYGFASWKLAVPLMSRDQRHNFDNSEMIAWLSATSLARLMENLNTSGQLRVLSHSQGNAVMGEALRKYSGAQKIKAYIAAQAAIGGSLYSQTGTNTDFNDTVLGVPVNCGPETPNILAYWNSGNAGSTNQPYFAANSNKVERMCNYYNAEDYALTEGWELDNKWKPDTAAGYGFGYGGPSITNYDVTESATATNRFYQWWLSIEGLSITNNADLRTRYEVFSYCAESRLRALGQASSPGFPHMNRNLETVPLNYDDKHYSHSREFRSNITRERAFFEYIMNDGNF